MRSSILSRIILGFLLLVLLLPLLNMLTGAVESGKLMGSVTLAGDARISIKGWMDGSYQAQQEKYLNDNIGFRPDFVRASNQLDYLAFRKLHQEGAVLGLDNFLHSDGYLRALNGDDYLGRDSIRSTMRRLRFISDTLNRAGKPLIFAFIPSKARVYPESIPSSLRKPGARETNYGVMLQQCREWGIRALDFNGWYLRMKPGAAHPLFTRRGIHWTRWSADRAADSFNRYLEPILKADLPDMRFGDMRCSTEPEDGEDDIGQALNLIWPVATDTFCYNDISWDYDSSRMSRPKIIFIADSFFWTWVHDGLPGRSYEGWEFWYYFHELWNQDAIAGHAEHGELTQVDWMQHIAQSDALVLFFTEANLSNPCLTKFVDEAYVKFGGK